MNFDTLHGNPTGDKPPIKFNPKERLGGYEGITYPSVVEAPKPTPDEIAARKTADETFNASIIASYTKSIQGEPVIPSGPDDMRKGGIRKAISTEEIAALIKAQQKAKNPPGFISKIRGWFSR